MGSLAADPRRRSTAAALALRRPRGAPGAAPTNGEHPSQTPAMTAAKPAIAAPRRHGNPIFEASIWSPRRVAKAIAKQFDVAKQARYNYGNSGYSLGKAKRQYGLGEG